MQNMTITHVSCSINGVVRICRGGYRVEGLDPACSGCNPDHMEVNGGSWPEGVIMLAVVSSSVYAWDTLLQLNRPRSKPKRPKDPI